MFSRGFCKLFKIFEKIFLYLFIHLRSVNYYFVDVSEPSLVIFVGKTLHILIGSVWFALQRGVRGSVSKNLIYGVVV